MPGIRRHRCGRGFRYERDDGRKVSARDLARIRALAIPPAYVDVWICGDPRGHLQATGRDARGRKQYRYHPDWRTRRDRGKFERMLEFGHRLPALRRRVRADLGLPGLARDKVLATLVRIMGRSLERIGNEAYRRENRSYGLSTLRNHHAALGRDGLVLRFRGKGGIRREVRIDDARVARLVGRCRSLPGQQLFEYRDEHGRVRRVHSGLVNDYIAATMGEGFSAKDIRTWGATQAAVSMLAPIDPAELSSATEAARVEREAVCGVARLLGNTATVCRGSYIDPRVFDAWRAGRLARLYQAAVPRGALQWERLTLRALGSR